MQSRITINILYTLLQEGADSFAYSEQITGVGRPHTFPAHGM